MAKKAKLKYQDILVSLPDGMVLIDIENLKTGTKCSFTSYLELIGYLVSLHIDEAPTQIVHAFAERTALSMLMANAKFNKLFKVIVYERKYSNSSK